MKSIPKPCERTKRCDGYADIFFGFFLLLDGAATGGDGDTGTTVGILRPSVADFDAIDTCLGCVRGTGMAAVEVVVEVVAVGDIGGLIIVAELSGAGDSGTDGERLMRISSDLRIIACTSGC